MDLRRIWGGEPNFKIFNSHKAENKVVASQLKENLKQYGISCFVAHEDIQPTLDWKEEIENAIFSADALIALLTEKFSDSNWTDQEIGIAYARKLTIIPVRLGKDPYGFIGKIQGLNCDLENDFRKVVSLLLKKSSKMVDVYINCVQGSKSFNESNYLATLLRDIESMNEEQAIALINAYNTNAEVSGSHGFAGRKPYKHEKFSEGLIEELKRITGKDYSELIKANS